MKKFVFLTAVLFIAASVSLTACGSKASDNSKATKESCDEHGKSEAKGCCDSTKVNAASDSTNKAGCCDGEKHEEPCDKPCEHKNN